MYLLSTVFVFRNDSFEGSFLACQLVEKVVDFGVFGGKVTTFRINSDNDLLNDALSQAVGAIYLKNPGERNSKLMDAEMDARLSFPRIVDIPLPPDGARAGLR